jgi:hypothetical protein
LRFSVHLEDETLVVLLLSLSHLAFKAVVTTFLLSKKTTFGGLPHFLDTLAVATTIFVQFDIFMLDSLDVSIAMFPQLPTS